MSGREPGGVRGVVRQVLALERDVLVLSVAMFAFSLGFQMTGRYVPEYLRVLGAGAGVIGLYGSLGNLLGAMYPYPGGALSDRVGSRTALTGFGVLSTVGFFVWFVAPELAGLGPLSLPAWAWLFVGLALTQAWKSLGLGATFAVVKQATDPEHLARGFASTETFRRIGFLVGPLLAAALLATTPGFLGGFRWVLVVAIVFGVLATALQHVLYSPEDTLGDSFSGVSQLLADLRALPAPLRPLLVADTLVRFANGMVYVFFVIVVTDFLSVGVSAFGVSLGFAVYALFPALLISAPANPLVVGLLFAFSGLRFAGLPAHKALIVGPAERDAGGRVTGAYYLLRNVVVIPSAAVGGWLYARDPQTAFYAASLVGVVGVGYFLLRGEEFEAYEVE